MMGFRFGLESVFAFFGLFWFALWKWECYVLSPKPGKETKSMQTIILTFPLFFVRMCSAWNVRCFWQIFRYSIRWEDFIWTQNWCMEYFDRFPVLVFISVFVQGKVEILPRIRDGKGKQRFEGGKLIWWIYIIWISVCTKRTMTMTQRLDYDVTIHQRATFVICVITFHITSSLYLISARGWVGVPCATWLLQCFCSKSIFTISHFNFLILFLILTF